MQFTDRLAQAIADPGSMLPRQPDESIPRWSARAVEQLLQTESVDPAAVAVVEAERDGYLDSATLDPAWKAGWHAAVDHVAFRLRGARKADA